MFAPLPPAATCPDTTTVLSSVASLSSTPVIFTVPVLSVAPAGMVSFLLSLRVTGEPAGTDTVTSVGRLDSLSCVAVTVVDSPSSSIDASDSTSVTCGRCFAGSRMPYFSTGYCHDSPNSSTPVVTSKSPSALSTSTFQPA